MAFISRDPFARQELHRTCVPARLVGAATCAWCGNRNAKGGLFEYHVERDGSGRQWRVPARQYCSIDCYRTFTS